MQLHDTIGQMFVVGFHGLEAPEYLLDWLREGQIGGVILFGRNVESPAQVARLTQAIHAAAKYPALIAIDQEGGTVARLRSGFTESPGAMALSAAENGPQLAEQMDMALAVELRAIGINWNFAPALDIAYNPSNPAVGTRAFGADPARVADMGAAAVRGFQRGGVAACAKHFPGLGNTAVDTHLALPVLDTPLDELLADHMQPFRAVVEAGVASIMTTHTIYTALDDQYPATLSPVVIQRLLRGELNYGGIVASDCMEMKAIADHHAPGETAVLGALAGLDILLFSHTREVQQAAFDELLLAVRSGRVPEALIDSANQRIATLKQAYPHQAPDLAVIRQPAHTALALQAARAGICLLHDDGLLPLDENTALVEFASVLESDILESGGLTGFTSAIQTRFPHISSVALGQFPYSEAAVMRAMQLARSGAALLLATRNAHLNAGQLDLARQLMTAAQQVVLVCLRNPYDAILLNDANTILCTCGDSTPSLVAAVDALSGIFTPCGVLPVPLDGD
ncbi:MAG: beta-N-acetylhexosaminidase [Anaerolineae bacterium]|nr:beta-N-acetylhexosaminidase [Anaerolineae bacterium]